MSKIIKALIACSSVLMVYAGCHANAAQRVVDGNNKKIFFVCTKDNDCKRVNALQANKAGESGSDVLACNYQDYECNERTGHCTLKNAR